MKFFGRIGWLFVSCASIMALLLVVLIIYVELQLPSAKTIRDVHLQVPLRIYTQDGKLLAEYGAHNRIPVRLDQIPDNIIHATLATEDRRYYSHPGVDPVGLLRAAIVVATTGRKVEGGSTITMQVARNYFLTRKKTYARKFREILLAYKIDQNISKDKVLELYFNKIFYGNHAYGIAAAAKIYYGKTLDQLTLAQSAMLAGLPKAPSALNPLADPVAALKRRDHVLSRMLDAHYISEEQYQDAINQPITASYHQRDLRVYAPYVAEMVRSALHHDYGKQVFDNGYKVYTTLNAQDQFDASLAVWEGLMHYNNRHGYRGPLAHWNLSTQNDTDQLVKQLETYHLDGSILQPGVVLSVNDDAKNIQVLLENHSQITVPWQGMSWARPQIHKGNQEYLGTKPTQPSDILHAGDVIYVWSAHQHWYLGQYPNAEAALISLNPHDGAITALVGGFNFNKNNFNHVTQAYRQSGSTFKPFVYSAALAKGYTLASMLNDAPLVVGGGSESEAVWRPHNANDKFNGLMSLKQALIQSRNLVSIRLLQLITIPYAIEYATRFGFEANEMPDGLSLALGTAQVTPLQMAKAYAVFANGGYAIDPYVIDKVIDRSGKVIYQAQPKTACANDQDNSSNDMCAKQVITPQNAFLMTQALKGVIKQGTGRAASVLGRHDLGGKTGTTNNTTNAWFCGFNHQLVSVVWVGFDKPQSLYEYAAQTALPIWIRFMRYALKGMPESNLPQPSGIVSVRVQGDSNAVTNQDQKAHFEYFEVGHVPQNKKQQDETGDTDTAPTLY